MANVDDSVHFSSDLVKDFSCVACESKHIDTSADFFCETCLKCFCKKCLYHHNQIYVNHLTYGRGETNKWPVAKLMEDLIMKCDIHNNEKLKMFCQDHSQLCCSDCVLQNHSRCTNLNLISESVQTLSVDMQQLLNKIQASLAELVKFKKSKEANIKSVEGSYCSKLQEIREQRKKLNAALDILENTTLKELDEIRTTLQTSFKKDVDKCTRLKDDLQQLGDAVQGLCDKSKKEMEFIASRKCTDKLQECKSYLKKNHVKVQSSIIFKANIDIEQYLSQQVGLGIMQFFTKEINPYQVLAVKRKSLYNVKIPNEIHQNYITGICSLPNGQLIVADFHNKRLKLLDEHFNVSSHWDVSGSPYGICLITTSEVAVTLGRDSVQFISLTKSWLVNERKLRLPHAAVGIAHHRGKLFITSDIALYHYTLTGTLVKKLYEDTRGGARVCKFALSPAGDKIYITNNTEHKLITLATDGTLISTFMDHELQSPQGVHVTPAGQVLVCGYASNTVIQVDREGKKKLATIASQTDGLSYPKSVCYNTITDQIIVAINDNIMVIDLQ